MSIAQLLQAAEFIDRREREAEHGYASSLPEPDDYLRKRVKPKKSQGNRSTHNELEKNRRANLRNYLEKLKDIVPLTTDSSRHTTLGLLTKAQGFIKNLEDKAKRIEQQKAQLLREQNNLHMQLEGLTGDSYRVRQERSISECSTSTASTLTSESDDHEVDVTGYNSPSDDDHSSIASGSDNSGSDGCIVNTRILSLEDSLDDSL